VVRVDFRSDLQRLAAGDPGVAPGQSGFGANHPGAVSAGPVSLQPAGVPKKGGAGLAIALGLAAVALLGGLALVFLRSPSAATPGGPKAISSATVTPTSPVDALPTISAAVATTEPPPIAAASAPTAPSAGVAGVGAPPLSRPPGKPAIPTRKPPKAGQPTDVGF
jgi:hypothetical protein